MRPSPTRTAVQLFVPQYPATTRLPGPVQHFLQLCVRSIAVALAALVPPAATGAAGAVAVGAAGQLQEFGSLRAARSAVQHREGVDQPTECEVRVLGGLRHPQLELQLRQLPARGRGRPAACRVDPARPSLPHPAAAACLGFGRIVASEIEAPNMLANLV